MSYYNTPPNDKNHPADEWAGESRTVAITGKTVEVAVAAIQAKAEGLDGARLRVSYGGEPYLTGFRPKTQVEKDQEAKKMAEQAAADAKRKAAALAQQEKRKAEIAAQDAAWKKQDQTNRERRKREEEAAAKRQARLIATQLREMGFVPVKKPKP